MARKGQIKAERVLNWCAKKSKKSTSFFPIWELCKDDGNLPRPIVPEDGRINYQGLCFCEPVGCQACSVKLAEWGTGELGRELGPRGRFEGSVVRPVVPALVWITAEVERTRLGHGVTEEQVSHGLVDPRGCWKKSKGLFDWLDGLGAGSCLLRPES